MKRRRKTKQEELEVTVRSRRYPVAWIGAFLTQVMVNNGEVSVFLPLDLIENLQRYSSVSVRLRPLHVAERRIEPTLIGIT